MQQKLQIVVEDPALEPHLASIQSIHQQFRSTLAIYDTNEGGLLNMALGYKSFGVHKEGDMISYKEWAPMAQEVYLYGDFNNWNEFEHKATKNQYGVWYLKIKADIAQYSILKARVKLSDGTIEDRVPAWITYAKQNEQYGFDGCFFESKYVFQNENPSWDNNNVKIYECHIGMSGVEPRIYSYKEFKETVDRVADLGYNVIQMMAIAQHPYYGSFGYHVSSFFAPSSKFGDPDDFKQLVDYIHSKNIKVLIDLVHAHAVKNTVEGPNMWDGTDYHYFHALPHGLHRQWDSRIFDYSQYEVQRFLLSNIRYWMQQFKVDGYRFDGVGSMIYKHHGIDYGFTGDYNQYFGEGLQKDALVYLMLANSLMKTLNPKSISIAEEVSGFPGLCRTMEEGGFGFDFRLAMAVPDMWIRLLKQVKDEDWKVSQISNIMANRRKNQKTIGYSESHDQALVGDKTIAMWLFDQQIYQGMSLDLQESIVVFRGMALHKMIRLVTMSLSGQGYLSFMGNEFGHPEWIDFPRDGNNWSYQYCRRKWNLLHDPKLRFHQLWNFDKAMIKLQYQTHFLSSAETFVSVANDEDHVLIYERGVLLFVFNFHPTQSFTDYNIPCQFDGLLEIVLDTDRADFGGRSRIQPRLYQAGPDPLHVRKNYFKMYLPSRSGAVLRVKQ